MAQPSKYTDALAKTICDRIAQGDSLITICQDADMPHRNTVLRWLEENEAFRAIHARAREAQADVMDQRIMAVADGCTVETANADRVKIDAYKWRAARLAPKRYGDKLALTGADDAPPIQTKLRVEFVEATKREKD